MKLEAIIFDLDGVICFTDEYHYLAWKALADSLGAGMRRPGGDAGEGYAASAAHQSPEASPGAV